MSNVSDDVELANRIHNTTTYPNGTLESETIVVMDDVEQEHESLLTDSQHDDSSENSNCFLETQTTKAKDDKAEEQKSLKYFQWKRVFQLIRSDIHLIIIGTFALLVGNLALLAVPYFVGSVIDATTQSDTKPKDEAKSELIRAVVILSSIIAVATLFSIIRAFLYNLTGERAVRKLRQQLFDSLVVQEIAFFDENKTGELLSRLASDCTVLQQTVTADISTTIRSSVSLLSGIAMLFYISWKLTILSLIVLPIIVLVAVIYGRFVKKLSKEYQEALAKASDTANEAISNIRTVRSFAKEEYEMENYLGRINRTYDLAKRRGMGFAGFTGAMTFLGNISIGAVLYYGGSLVLDGELTAGQLTSFIIYSLSVATSLGNITGLYGDLMKAMGASERVFQLLDRKPKVNWKGGKPISHVEGHVELRDVHFSYPSRPDVKVLNGINVDLKPGQVVALVGRSGGGKSTVALLIESFYYPTQGSILIDGQDLKTLDPQQWRQNVAIVSQEPTLFGTTIGENIAYGKQVPLDKIIQVAKMANAHQFISEFPNGYDTVVGERGIRLSGGQKQRIAIARALLIDPKILLLDEATSALDAESEYLVKQALDTLMKGRTVLVIAHRLSTVRNANTVCVVQKGKIIEQGTHSELLNVPNGVYLKLVKRQLLQE